MTTAAETLRTAANLIDEHGWTQGEAYRTPEGDGFDAFEDWAPGCSMCAIGALELAGWEPGRGYSFVESLREELSADLNAGRDRRMSVPYWNDMEDRTADEVTAQLRATADRLEREATSKAVGR